jgi:hypothetical protein
MSFLASIQRQDEMFKDLRIIAWIDFELEKGQ